MKQQLKYDKIKKGDSMFCPKCKIENKDNFCIKCGYMLNKEIEVQINYKEQGKKEKETHKLKAYIGKDNHKILNEIFNTKAFIFGPLYYIYRKCYLIGYLFLAIYVITISFSLKLDHRIFFVVLCLNSLFHYCFFNEIYTKICKQEIKKIENAKEKGTSIISPFISLLLVTIVFYLIYLFK